MKKLIAMMLALVMCVGMMSVVASAAGGPALSVSSAKGEAGDTVELTVKLTNNPGIAMLEVGVDYDSSRLTLVEMDASKSCLSGAMAATKYIWVASSGDSTETGTLMTIKFKINDGATPGDVNVKLNVNCANWAEEVLSAGGSTTGEVTVTCDHQWGEWTVTKEATCSAEGEKVRTCALCGETEKKAIEKLEHSWSDWEVTKAATCKAKGEKTRTCAVCGETETKSIKKADHKYKDGKCIWCGKAKGGYDNVPSTGDITPVVTMGVVAMISVVAAAAYVTKRRITK